MVPLVYLNNRFVAEDVATLSISDGGWLHGAGLFETLRAEGGTPFRLEAHMERLRRSAEKLLRPLERNQLPQGAVFSELLERNHLRSARVRLTVSAGPMRHCGNAATSGASTRGAPIEDNSNSDGLTICITASRLAGYPELSYSEGIKVIVCPYRQSADDPTTGHKTTGYLSRLLGLREAQRARCPESLWFTSQNELAEASISNVFLVQGGVLRTPSLETPVLPGITREVVLALAREAGIPVDEGRLTIHDLLQADECFLTNSIMQVMPVIGIEKHDVGSAKVGPITKNLSEAYRSRVRQECEA